MAKIVWQSKITSDMVKGWSDNMTGELITELDDAVQRIFEDLESQFDEDFNAGEEEDEEEED